MGYRNPLGCLPTMYALMRIPMAQRRPIEALMRVLRADAKREARLAMRLHRSSSAGYWRAAAQYAEQAARTLEHNRLGRGRRVGAV
jgi:hypothetical protein